MKILAIAILIMMVVLSGVAVIQVEGITSMRSAYTQSTRVANQSNYYGLNQTAFARGQANVVTMLNAYETAILNDPAARIRLEANQPPIEASQAASFFSSSIPFVISPLDGLVELAPIPGPPQVGTDLVRGLNSLRLNVNGQVQWLRLVNQPLVDDPSTPINESTAYSPWLYELKFSSEDASQFEGGQTARYNGIREFQFTFRAAKSTSTVVPPRPVEPVCATFNACTPPAPPIVPPPTPPAYPTYSATVERQ